MKKKAYTLLELIIVLGIISLLMSVVALKFDIVKKVRIKNELNTMVADMNYCKQKARVTGVDYGFAIDDDRSYSVQRLKLDNQDKLIPTRVKTVRFKELEITGNNLKGGNQISFKPTGSVANPGTISVKGLDKSYSISIGVAGANIQVKEE